MKNDLNRGKAAVVVLGSINADITIRMPRLPIRGESLVGTGTRFSPGGKGANQAVAAGKLRAKTSLLAKLGDDLLEPFLRDTLEREGIDTSYVTAAPGRSCGVAIIVVEPSGHNTILVDPGANLSLDESDVMICERLCDPSTVFLAQLEVDEQANLKGLALARNAGATTVLDPGPIGAWSEEFLRYTDYLTPNETEFRHLTGLERVEEQPVDRIVREGRKLLELGVDSGLRGIVIKRAERGALYVSEREVLSVPPYPVEAVDTTGAGDAFNAGFGVALGEGRSIREALVWGSVAGALSVTRPGTQSAMPEREEVEAHLPNHPPVEEVARW